MRIVNLASGSKGNSTFIGYNDSKILIDVGLTEKTIRERLTEINEDIKSIVGVCITHEHSDHIKALATLAKKYDIDFYVHKKLAESTELKSIIFKDGKLHTFENEKFLIGELEICPFDTSHDAVSPVGFTVNVKNSVSKFGIITDTGIVSEKMKQALIGSKIVFIESNYDEMMLENGIYPYPLKRRIAGSQGHLSNVQSVELADYLFNNGTMCFVLSHLSENNNTPEIAFLNYANHFENRGLVLDNDVFVRLSYQYKHGNNFNLLEDFNG